jgi:AraC-like DNA-binding protein
VLHAAIAFSLSQLLLSLALLGGRRPWQLSERLFCLLLLAIGCYLAVPVTTGTVVGPVFVSLQSAVPGTFWLFSGSVFDDHFRLRGWQVTLVLLTVLLPVAGRLLGAGQGSLTWFLLPQLLEFVLLAMTLWTVARHWRIDLVASRRRLRALFIGLNGLYITALLLSRELLFSGAPWLLAGQYLVLASVLLTMNAVLLRYREDGLFRRDQSTAPDGEAPRPDPAPDLSPVTPLQELMDAGAYREMGLTIGQLADRLEVPQYRLRQAINGGLGYRNFSDFLNSYRVAETARRLRDPAETDLPVLTIAMDAGFRSLSSFNKVFKETHGQTPTAYRKAAKI